MELGKMYFYTATILNWKKLLKQNKYKDIIINSLRFLSERNKIRVYGFVIMPNHIHLIWRILEMSGKEMPHASFMKFTAHAFLKDLQNNHPQVLPFFEATGNDRKYQFWERESLPIELYTQSVMKQKLDYIHNNPLQAHWNLVENPAEYFYSSIRFYEEGIDDFGFLHPYFE